MTAMKDAFERAGAETRTKTLYVNAAKALNARRGNVEMAADDVLREIQLSGDIKSFLKALAIGFIRFVAFDMNAPKGASGVQAQRDDQSPYAPGSINPASAGAVGQEQCESQSAFADSNSMPPSAAGGGHRRDDGQDEFAPTASTPATPGGEGHTAFEDQRWSAFPNNSSVMGQSDHDNQASFARSARSEPLGDKGQRSRDIQNGRAPPEAPKPIQRGPALTPERLKKMALNRMTELGRPVGECSANDLRNLIRKSVVNATYYGALLHGMPDTGVVADYYTEAEAAKALHIAQTHQGLQSAIVTLRKPTDYHEVANA